MRKPYYLDPNPIVRFRVLPEEGDVFAGPRRRGSRRPHGNAKVAQVRRFIEETTLTYGEIAARTNVGRASICRWARDGKWQRPVFAPRATDLMPRERASAQLKRRMLAARLDALAERYIRELEASACVDPDKLGEALELLKMAKLAARPRHRPRPRRASAPGEAADHPSDALRRPIMQLCAGDVDLRRAPRAAVEDFLSHREPPRQEESGPRRGRRSTARARQHAWMLEKE